MEASRRLLGSGCLMAGLVASGAAHAADILSSAVIYGGVKQKRAVCYFTNVAQAPITLNNFGVVDQNGTAAALVINGCANSGGVLPALRSCGIAADIANNAPYLCRKKTQDKTNLRGTIEIRDVNQAVLSSQDLQ